VTLRHVLVIGVDGVRFDLLGPEVTPVIWRFGQDGFLGPVLIDETTPTWSGPCWATIATGCGVDGHGITGNDLTGHRLADHPDFVTLATRAGLPTLLAVSGWPPLALAEDGGPLFAEAARREFVPVAEASLEAWDAADEAVTARAASILAADAPRLSFVYLGAVDVTGHTAGAGAAYREAARAADQRVGRLLAAVRSRRGCADEGWTVVVVTDHGHLDQGGHGGREPEVATAWAAAAGPDIQPGGPVLVTSQTQVAPLVLAALGLRPRAAHRGLDGLQGLQ
jgi:predicted AlkP superfamily pyrophosphatase or phosphodiesterase